MRGLVGAVFCVLLLSGCTTDNAVDSEPPDSAIAPAPIAPAPMERSSRQQGDSPMEVNTRAGSMDAGLGANTPSGRACWFEANASNVLQFDVLENTTAIVLELAWSDQVADLTMVATPPGKLPDQVEPCPDEQLIVANGTTGSPDSVIRLRVERPAAGPWALAAQANGLIATRVTYNLYATVSAGALPIDYTAVPSQP